MLQRTCHRRASWTLLVESNEPGVEISDFVAFRDAGFAVSACTRPGADPAECPVVRGGRCALLDDADVVLFDLGGGRPGRSTLLAAMRAARPDLPIVVRSGEPPAGAPEGCHAIPTTTSVNGQVSAVRKAMLRRTGRRSPAPDLPKGPGRTLASGAR